MLKVYIAGAYSADNVIDVLKNIGRGEHLAAQCFLAGFAPFTPWHDKDFIIKYPNENFDVKSFYAYSMEWLKVSDAVLLVEGWEKSKGTLAEIEQSVQLDIPVFSDLESLVKWSLKREEK